MKGRSLVNFLSYIAIAFIAIAVVLSAVFRFFDPLVRVADAMTIIAQVIAYAIVAVFAFYYAKNRKKIGWMVAYIIFIVVIVIFLAVGAVKIF